MVKSISLTLSGGEFEIVYGTDFSVKSDCLDHLVYEKDDVWYVVSDPQHTKYANTTITIPYQSIFYTVLINITDGVLEMCKTACENIFLYIKNSTVEADTVSQRLRIAVGHGNARICAKASYINIDCGYGTIDLHPEHIKNGYKINSKCGMGNVTLNSAVLPKQYVSQEGERQIEVICGMGAVNIYT